MVRDDALAQDAVQEAFLAVWRAAGGYLAERSKPSTWVMTLVHRRAVDLVRREEHRRADSLAAEHEPIETSPDEAETILRRRTVREALRRLPAEQRETIELAYYGGYTQSELAEQLEQPLGTIKSRMFAGMNTLREHLESADGVHASGPGS